LAQVSDPAGVVSSAITILATVTKDHTANRVVLASHLRLVEGLGLSRCVAFRNLGTLHLNGSAVTDDGLSHLCFLRFEWHKVAAFPAILCHLAAPIGDRAQVRKQIAQMMLYREFVSVDGISGRGTNSMLCHPE
jgi:hypothetical protein